MDLYEKKALSISLALLVVIVGLVIAWWGYSTFIGAEKISCGVSARSGVSCNTKFGFLLVIAFIVEALGLTYIRSKYLGY